MSDSTGPSCLSWEQEVLPAEPLAHSVTLATRIEMGHPQKGCTLALHLGMDAEGGRGAGGRRLWGSP